MQFLFQKDGIAWKLLRDDPDRYIYEPVRQGVNIPLPEDIEAGVNDVSKRDDWNKPAAPDYALPTETWREHIARRHRCLELRQKLADGEINSINDLITYNLNIRQLAQDVIENCYDPELVWAFYQAITKITILDPTCGSGAFLFSALNILEPLYEACFEQMQMFLDEGFVPQNENCVQILEKFRQILKQAHSHRNFHYFIIKSIVINNLYGVDIMQEATEICKLRLFLKLTSQVEPDISKPNNGIEPLPDIDFNIRAGNTLVGFASLDEVRDAITKESHGQMKLVYDSSLVDRIEEKAQAVDRSFQDFRDLQIGAHIDSSALSSKKTELRTGINQLREELDCYLADEYEMELSKRTVAFERWRGSHQPFHWLVEFYRIFKQGGFNVIIGNPPYVETSKIKDYKILKYQTKDCGNIYSTCIERFSSILEKLGKLGVIVPLSGCFTERMEPYQHHIYERFNSLYISYYSGDAHPSVMFSGVKYRLSIILGSISSKSKVYTTSYLRWYADERENLFPKLAYTECHSSKGFLRFAKTGSVTANQILNKMLMSKPMLCAYLQKDGVGWINYHRSPVFWIRSMDFEPYFHSATRSRSLDHLKDLRFITKEYAKAIGAMLNSTCFYFWFSVQGNCRNIAGSDITSFPVGKLSNQLIESLIEAFTNLMDDLRTNSKRRIYNYQNSGRVEYDEFYSSKSKDFIDEIDQILAQHYNFTDEELDFIINYDIKYRMGRDSEDESSDE